MTNSITDGVSNERLAKLMEIGIEQIPSGLNLTETYTKQRNLVLKHFRDGLKELTPEQRESLIFTPKTIEQLRKGVIDYIQDRGYFEPAPKELAESIADEVVRMAHRTPFIPSLGY